MRGDLEKFIKEAESFSNAANIEFEQGVKENKDEKVRNAAEKAWNSLVLATTGLLLAKGFNEKEIKTYRQKRLALEELSSKDGTIKDKGFGERFMAREYTLHIRCFYDGEYSLNIVKEELEKVKRYIEEVKNLIQ